VWRVCLFQVRSRFCVRTQTAAGHLRRLTYVKFTYGRIPAKDRTSVICRVAARRLPAQLTTRTTSAFTPVYNTCVLSMYNVSGLGICLIFRDSFQLPFSALTLLGGRQRGHSAGKSQSHAPRYSQKFTFMGTGLTV